jgi:hypothetical protein
MRLSRIWPVIPAILIALSPVVHADDTQDFLKAANWEGHKENWDLSKLADGTIVGTTDGKLKANTFLCSKEKYGDFELSFKVKLVDEVGNSGVQIRSEVFDAKDFRVKGAQADIGKGYWGSLYGEGVGGMMKQSDPEKIKTAVKPKDVNEYKIVAKGNKITVSINGEVMVDGEFKETKDKKPLPAEGIIAFQAHVGPTMRVEYTDIKFKKLK